MAKHLMKYGEQEFSVNLDEDCIACELESNTVSLPQRTAREHVDYALDHPIGSPRLEEIVKPGQTVCIVAPDATRLWQSPHVYIPAVVERLNACGVPDAHIRILTATGSHRSMTREEHMAIVSEDIYKRIPVVDHVCTDSKNMVKAGVTSHGTEVWFNRLAMESDHIVLTGGVVYHFLAGYGGGPKYMLPGIASYETIQRHHNLALNKGFGSGSNPAVRSANLTRDNVFHTDLEEAALLGRPIPENKVHIDRNMTLGEMGHGRSPIGWLAAAVLGALLRRSIKKGKPDLNILFQYNMPLRALAKMTNGAISMGMVDGIVMELQGFWIIGLVRVIFEAVKNLVLNSRMEERLKNS